MVERPWSAGGQPRRFFRIPEKRKQDREKERGRHERQKRRKGEESYRRSGIPLEKVTGE